MLDAGDEDHVISDLEVVHRRALGPGEHVLVQQREARLGVPPRHLLELVVRLRREEESERLRPRRRS